MIYDSGSAQSYLFQLCKDLGLPIAASDDTRTRHMWDGHDLAISNWLTIQEQCHEIAHWIIAPPMHRHLPDFGLGLGQYSHKALSNSSDERRRLDKYKLLLHGPHPDEDRQEELASMLGFFIELEASATATIDDQLVIVENLMDEAMRFPWRWGARQRYVPWTREEQYAHDKLPWHLRPRAVPIPVTEYCEFEMGKFFRAITTLMQPPYSALALAPGGQMAFVHRNPNDRFKEPHVTNNTADQDAGF